MSEHIFRFSDKLVNPNSNQVEGVIIPDSYFYFINNRFKQLFKSVETYLDEYGTVRIPFIGADNIEVLSIKRLSDLQYGNGELRQTELDNKNELVIFSTARVEDANLPIKIVYLPFKVGDCNQPYQILIEEFKFMYIVEADHPDTIVTASFTVKDSEGNVLDPSAVKVEFSAENQEAINVFPIDEQPLSATVHFVSPGLGSVNCTVSTHEGVLLASFGAQFTIVAGDPSSVTGGNLSFEGLTES